MILRALFFGMFFTGSTSPVATVSLEVRKTSEFKCEVKEKSNGQGKHLQRVVHGIECEISMLPENRLELVQVSLT